MSDLLQILYSKYGTSFENDDIIDAIKEINLASAREVLLSKKGVVASLFGKIKEIDPKERKQYGEFANRIKVLCEEYVKTAEYEFAFNAHRAKMESEAVDITLPVYGEKKGSLNPITVMTEELVNFLSVKHSFEVFNTREIETDFYNFTALNIPDNHPARDMHDTFYTDQGEVLRTHTSTSQIHKMMSSKPPLRIISHGKVFRSDNDRTHTPTFHQLECLVVDKGISLGNMKHVISDTLRHIFANSSSEMEIRFRPSYFPFTEPSFEVDIRMSKESEWLEVMGCGMVHPNVFKACGLEGGFTGFAFGMGIERFAMLKYCIPDLREFFESRPNWMESFCFR